MRNTSTMPTFRPSDYARYATILFFKGDYAKSKEIVEQALPKTPRDLVLNRLMFYNDFELGNKEAARSEADKFFMPVTNGRFHRPGLPDTTVAC